VPYYGAKWQMEQDIRASGLEHVIMRPSLVFGRSGGVLPTFIRQVRLSPVVTVLGPGENLLQPLWIEDVAAHYARVLDLPAAANRTFELGGPEQVTWNELYARIAKVLGKRRSFVHVPFGVARAGALMTQWIPWAPLTSDQVTMIEAGDNVVTTSDAAETLALPVVGLNEQIRRAAP
jgi:NADH dehydrogenase